MTFIDNLKASGTLCEGVGPQRPRVAAALLERCGERKPSRVRVGGRGARRAADVSLTASTTANWSKR